MSDQNATIISRIGKLFKKGYRPIELETPLDNENGADQVLSGPVEQRSTFLRPWAKRDVAIDNLQHGLSTLSDLMVSIRDNMERQSERQDELVKYLSHLPQALEHWPESSRVQGETLKAIHQQIEHQSGQQTKLADILERIGRTDEDQGKVLSSLQEHVQTLSEHDQAISSNLNHVGSAMATVSKSSEASTQVLQQLRDNMNSRDGEIQRIIQKQGLRFTTLLAIAIFLAIGAVVAVCIFGYMVLDHLK